MMGVLYYFFERPMAHVLSWATVVFVLLYFLTRSKQRLSAVVYAGIILEMIFVSLHFTARLNNIVILKDISFQVINYTLLLLWMAHILEEGGFRLAPSPMNIAVFVFFVFCVIGGYWSPRIFWYYACEWMSRYGASVALFFLMVKFLNTRGRWNIALYTFLAMMVITSVYCIMQVKGYDFMSWGRIVNVSTFGNKDFAASYWTYCMPIALFMAIGARNVFDGSLYMAMAMVCFYNIYTGETRGAWVGLMALAGLTFLFESRFGRLRAVLGDWKKQAIFWCGILLVIIVVASSMSEHRKETFKSIFQFERGTNIIRVYMWWTGARMLWDEPVLGQGLGASHVTYPFFRPDRYHRIGMSHNTDYVHSEELQFLCEQGILGFSAWAAMLLVFFYICYQKLKKVDDLSERYLLFGLAGAFFAGVVHDSMNVNLRWTSSILAFWYVLALGTRYCFGFEDAADRKKQIVKEMRRRTWAEADGKQYLLLPVVTAAFAFMFYGQYRVLRADWSLKTTEEAGGQHAINKGLDTLKYNPYSHSAYYKVAYHYLNENKIQDALGMYHGLLQVAPNYAQTHQNTGLIHYRLFFNSNQRKYIYQSLMEFEWATILENNFENHTKLLQLYNQVINDSSRGRYHNQFLIWNSLDDGFWSLLRYWRSAENHPPADNAYAYSEWITPIVNFSKDYWLYRTDTVRRVGRPRDEVRYAMKMAARYVPTHSPLIQFTIGTLLAPSPQPDEDLVYLINMVEHLDPHMATPEIMIQARQTLLQRYDSRPGSAIVAYALGVFSHKAGDVESARRYFQTAQTAGGSQYELIRTGLKKYKI